MCKKENPKEIVLEREPYSEEKPIQKKLIINAKIYIMAVTIESNELFNVEYRIQNYHFPRAHFCIYVGNVSTCFHRCE